MPAVQVLLAGGGLIVAEAVRTDNEQLHIESSPAGRACVIPLDLSWVITFYPPHDPQESPPAGERIGDWLGASDKLLLENGDELTGTVDDGQ